MSRPRQYQETIDYLFGLQKHGIKLGLETSALLMEALGTPQSRFRSVHIAGTNGKGSTAAYLSSLLSAAGLRVGLYTSPHLVDFTERIRVNGVAIPEETVVELAQQVREAYRRFASAQGLHETVPTFFEVTTAMAFCYFAAQQVDLAVVETGMGGRLDATNIITPLVSIITNIACEHTQFLGTTLEAIAREKAGIIKQGVPLVTGVTQPEVIAVIEEAAQAKSAPVLLLGRDVQAENVRTAPLPPQFDYRGIRLRLDAVRLGLLGRHQARNAALALAAAECLRDSGLALDAQSLRTGLERARWEGRLERVSERPDVYLDGAHNPAAAKVLAEAVREMGASYGKRILVLGILADKDSRGILAELLPLADRVIITRPAYSRALDGSRLAAEARSLHDSVSTTATLAEALAAARAAAGPNDLILVTGSLYLVGEARALLVQDDRRRSVLAGLNG